MKTFTIGAAQMGDVYVNPDPIGGGRIFHIFLDYRKTLLEIDGQLRLSNESIPDWFVYSHNIAEQIIKLAKDV
jgi:hypothetical protein